MTVKNKYIFLAPILCAAVISSLSPAHSFATTMNTYTVSVSPEKFLDMKAYNGSFSEIDLTIAGSGHFTATGNPNRPWSCMSAYKIDIPNGQAITSGGASGIEDNSYTSNIDANGNGTCSVIVPEITSVKQTVTMQLDVYDNPGSPVVPGSDRTLSFNPPPYITPSNPPAQTPLQTAPANSSPKKTATAIAPPAQAPIKPLAPTAAVSLDGITQTDSRHIAIRTDQVLHLAGVTSPNGEIELEIHSTPRYVKLQADTNGKWEYSLSGLELGAHSIYATVTDPSTKLTSPQASLLEFTVTASPKVVSSLPVSKKSSDRSSRVIVSMLAITVLAVSLVQLRKRRRKQNEQYKRRPRK